MHSADNTQPLATTLPLQGGLWDAPRAFWRMAPKASSSLEERVAALEQEREVRDLYARYFDALDSRDLEAILSFFHDDAVHVGDDGSFVGKAAIRAFYETSLPTARAAAHNTGNVSVKILTDSSACINSRNFTVLCQDAAQLLGIAANVTVRVAKQDDTWLIAERRTSIIATYVLTQERTSAGQLAGPESSGPRRGCEDRDQ